MALLVMKPIIIKQCRAGPGGFPCGICKPGHTHHCKYVQGLKT